MGYYLSNGGLSCVSELELPSPKLLRSAMMCSSASCEPMFSESEAQALPLSPSMDEAPQPQEQPQVPTYEPHRLIVALAERTASPSHTVNSITLFSGFNIPELKNNVLNVPRFLKWVAEYEAFKVPLIRDLCALLTARSRANQNGADRSPALSSLSGEQWASLYYLGCASVMPPNTRYSGPPPVQAFANGRSDFYAALYAKYVTAKK